MKTRKPTLADNIRTLKNEIERRKFFIACKDEQERKEDEAWIENAQKKINAFYASPIR